VIKPIAVPPITIPDGCDADSVYTGTTSCNTSFSCSGQYYSTYCGKSAGAWSCSCSSPNTSISYELSGLKDDDVCNFSVQACVDGSIQPTGDETCEAAAPSNQEQYCSASNSCTKTADLGNGVTAKVVTGSSSVSCSSNGDDTYSCYCYDDKGSYSYNVSSDTAEAACTGLTPICINGEEPTYSEDEQCDILTDDNESGYCSYYANCSRTADLGGGVSAVLTEYQSTSCSESGDTWSCSCNSSSSYMSYTVTGASDNYCHDATKVCDNAAEVAQSNSPRSCEVTSETAGSSNCSGAVTCTQDATVAGIEITAQGSQQVYCSPDGDNWSCSCGNEYFSSPKTSPEWDSCETAIMKCSDSVVIGQSGGGMGGFDIVGGFDAIGVPVADTPASTSSMGMSF
jgi:hypothetical protein